MCNVCGCGQSEMAIGNHPSEHVPHHHDHEHHHEASEGHGHHHRTEHSHERELGAEHHDYGSTPARAHAPGLSQARMVRIEQDILSKNQALATGNRRYFAERAIFALNLLSSPGAGKTTLLVRTIETLGGQLPIAVIEGDQQTTQDADRIRQAGVPALQINTGKGCHLDAHMVGRAARSLGLERQSLLFIENVGNLVCPALFDLGEAQKVVILSVTEGDNKPLKYPDMFRVADVLLLNKMDLLPYVEFEVERAIAAARRLNPAIEVIPVSATRGDGMEYWLAWLLDRRLDFLQRLSAKPAIGL
ncbi:MAG: hydrogenase nickel incorporation protein HypB [Gammaproteobacteria bacterium]